MQVLGVSFLCYKVLICKFIEFEYMALVDGLVLKIGKF